MPHNDHKWILHIVDHWSKFTFAFPIPSKSARDVANALQKHIFPVKLVADLMQTREKSLTIEFVDVQKQKGSSDCGLFALAFITSICNRQDPTELAYNQSSMRSHLLKRIE